MESYISVLYNWYNTYNYLLNPLIIIICTYIMAIVAFFYRRIICRLLSTGVSSKFSNIFDEKIMIVGLLHHELAHAFLAIISGAKLVEFSILPKKIDNAFTIGHISLIKRGPLPIRMLQGSLSGFAPLICGEITVYIIFIHLIQVMAFGKLAETIFLVFIAFSITYHMGLSKQDIKSSIFGTPVIYIVLYILYNIFNINITIVLNYYGFILALMIWFITPSILVSLIGSIIKNLVSIHR